MSLDDKEMKQMVDSINQGQFQNNDQYSYNFDRDKTNIDPNDPVPTKVETKGHLAFGPYVAYFKVHQSFLDGLLARGKARPQGSGNSRLAGLLGDQRRYGDEDKEWYIRHFQPYIDEYVEGHCRFVGQPFNEAQFSKSYTLMDLWINFMKEREYNPQHSHGGQFSWVIYLKTPDIKAEREAFKGTGLGPGVIGFHYGENQAPKWAEHSYKYEPIVGYMWIFPAQLRHEVLPYTTKGERISVSGNCYMNPPNQKTTYLKTEGAEPYVGLGRKGKITGDYVGLGKDRK